MKFTSSFLFPGSQGSSARFEEFFASGMEETSSPLLTADSRPWGKHIPMKASLLAAFFLLASFLASFFPSQLNLSYLFLLLTYFLAGTPALISAVEDILHFEIKIDVLMTLAAFLSILIGNAMEGALLLVLFSFSGSLEEAVRKKATSALILLQRLAPTKAFVLKEDGSLVERSLKDIPTGTLIHIKAGQVVPLDGKIVAGVSSLSLIHLTGENLPHPKHPGDDVPAGGYNLEGALTVKVTQTSSDSTLARIIQLIIQAQESKPKLQRWLDSLSARYAMGVILLSGLCALTLPLLAGIPFLGNEGSIYRSLSFLVAASPCALILAIPIAYLSAISACAHQGILLKGGVVLDALASCTTLAMDKTGTLTQGKFTCRAIEPYGRLSSEEALQIAYGLERNAVHPIARTICAFAEEMKCPLAQIDSFRSLPGYGVEGIHQGIPVKMGTMEFVFPSLPSHLREKLIDRVRQVQQSGEILTLLSKGEDAVLFRFKDVLRPKIAETIYALKQKYRLSFLMLTGDHEESAKGIAAEAGIDTVFFDLKPEDKLSHISRLAEKGHLAMVGDGVNDAPALARATVGISMGKGGSSTAIDASDIVFLEDHIERLDWLFEKAHATKKIVKQNVAVALIAILFASLPALFGWIPLWLAVIVHEGGTVAVGLNALRLLFRHKRRLP